MSWMREPDDEPIAGYRLIEPLGSGGFGEVWKCEAPGGLEKAIKFVYGNLNSVDVDSVRAEQELNALQRIKEVRHPFVCSLDRIETNGGELIIVMELCDKTLHDVYKDAQTAGMIGIPRQDLLRYMRDAAEALDYMNERHKLQHLDVKPRNLFLSGDRVKVADFGLVKHLELLSASGMLGGVTPLYASPETFNGKISQSSDQYSLAIVYQEMLTGHRPFGGKNVRQMAQQHLQGEPDLRALPEAERAVVAKALSKDPDERYPNCLAFIGALFKAKAPVKKSAKKREPELVGARQKTLADTLEDIFLDDISIPDGLEDDAVDLGSPDIDSGQHLLEASDVGVTVAQPDTGALRPTLFVGVGAFGRKAMMELRCRFVDRFGELEKIPLFRFLYLDSDPEIAGSAVKGAPEVALTRNEVQNLPLQPVTNYRRRILDQLAEWLPREKLYAMPRSLQPQGSRALGRLAFVDNHQRLLARVRREIQEVTDPEIAFQSSSNTGLAVRDATPRVFIVASASGGTSGMLPDLSYAVRRLLAQMRHPDAELNFFLLCSAPSDPASPKMELANVYATLTELAHFSDPNVPFAAEYGMEGQRIVDQGTPSNSTYLLPLPHRGPDALEDVVSHLGSYLFHETTTPLGAHLSRKRMDKSNAGHGMIAAPFRSLGTYGVWFPRGLLLRLASRLACRRLIETWLADDDTAVAAPDPEHVVKACEEIAADPQLSNNSLESRIEESTREAHLTDLGATPAEAVFSLLSNLEEQSAQSVASEDPGNWARQALNRVRDWIGGVSSMEVQEWRKTRVNRALLFAAKKVAEKYANGLSGRLERVMNQPGGRVACAEMALDRLEKYCGERAKQQKVELDQHQTKTAMAWQALDGAMAECFNGGGGFRLFGGRSKRRLLSMFMEKLSAFAKQRLKEELAAAVHQFFVSLCGQIDDLRRDLGFCRQRLRHMQENLDAPPAAVDEDMTATRPGSDLTVSRTPVASTEAYWEAIRQSATARVLLPENEEDLERAAVKLLHRLTARDWKHLDSELHDRVLEPRGGLFTACMKSGDLSRGLAMPLTEESINLLGEYLPVMDVAQILASDFGFTFNVENMLDQAPSSPALAEHTKKYLDRAAPLMTVNDKTGASYLLIPASPAGKALSTAIADALPELCHVKVPGQADLMFCQDYGPLGGDDLRELFKICQQAYEDAAPSPVSSPHARFDITDWIPLAP